ncbi:hypothetical protein KDK95_13785 [Actinospica sp. MGRD01-02]|uniref:Uncharacterized protein n=1 Tax=Actinospica acidithermotolerans TaxID=2828514 RepID=A0A941IHM7_9ACTN|nr:DUF6113 family protein [Actinospica acidithermotolerans]MBR7827384.1 hypothetical protein [Actinospica acidithermotolerans]
MTTPPDTKPAAAPTAAGRATRIALSVLLLAAGLAVGTVGAFYHRAEFTTGTISWPNGLLLSLGGLVGLLLGLGELLPVVPTRREVPARLPGVAFAAAGWVIAVIWLSYIGPPFSFANKGDVILANDWISMAFLIVGMALATFFLYRAWIASLDAKLARARG